jgi:hypothetical protein
MCNVPGCNAKSQLKNFKTEASEVVGFDDAVRRLEIPVTVSTPDIFQLNIYR